MLLTIIILVIILLCIIFVLCEIDRNSMIPYTLYEYYIDGGFKKILFGLHNTIYRMYNQTYIFDPNILTFNNFLNKNKETIKQNFLNSPEKLQINAHSTTDMFGKDNTYKYIFFKYQKNDYSDNLNNFPIISNLLTDHPEIHTCFFSIMKAKKNIPYHRGPYSGLLRYHIPIIMEPNTCYIEILGNKLDYSSEFLFDDTYPHKLVKTDNSLRVVLICDIDNPYSFIHPHKWFTNF
jgi:aspartyl/asparaginyl beta-hydroxylase (cupin superfamily)